jgi:nucleotide-binding universal stress UspA family protein
MISTMLIPLDGSAAAEAALAYVPFFPVERVRLLRVEPEIKEPMMASPAEWAAWQEAREADARAYLERIGERLRHEGREVDPVVVRGDPAAQVLAHAGDADLIVMTTHGRGAASRAFFGSVADRVARHATVPTLLIRADLGAGAPPRVDRIVVPLDGSSAAERAVAPAEVIARRLGVPMLLVRVFDIDLARATVMAGADAAIADAHSQAAIREQAAAALEADAAALRERGVAARAVVRVGNTVGELLDIITPSDLIVMTTRGHGGISRWLLGSVTDKLMREAPAPVLLVHPGSGSTA